MVGVVQILVLLMVLLMGGGPKAKSPLSNVSTVSGPGPVPTCDPGMPGSCQ
jgi:hypothetical protein